MTQDLGRRLAAYALLNKAWGEMVSRRTHIQAWAWGDPDTESYGMACVARGEAARMLVKFIDDEVPPFSGTTS